MHVHVDVVRNDWASSRQVLIGRLYLLDADVKFDLGDSGLAVRLNEPIPTADGGTLSAHDGAPFLEALSRRWSGDYTLVTALHDDDACPFADADEIPMQTKMVLVPEPRRVAAG